MKNLTLIRHAESHLQRPLEQDKERLLTPNGFHQVSTISKQLEKKKMLARLSTVQSCKTGDTNRRTPL